MKETLPEYNLDDWPPIPDLENGIAAHQGANLIRLTSKELVEFLDEILYEIKGGIKMIQLGQKVKDIITGFTGIAHGRATYLAGCNRILVQPEFDEKKDDKYPDAVWIDEPQLKTVGKKIISLSYDDPKTFSQQEKKKPGGPPGYFR